MVKKIQSTLSHDNSILFKSDADECTADTDNCHENAMCANTIGSFICTCLNGHSGDGVMCNGKGVFFIVHK